MPDAQQWALERRRGSAEELHHAELDLTRRSVVVFDVDRPALVLGSTQDEASVDLAAVRSAGLDLTRRRSGGGAVLLVPGEHLWFDVTVPASDVLHSDDVGRSSWWLGEAVVTAFMAITAAPAAVGLEVHRDGLSDRDLGRLVCFAAVGPGEVTMSGAKLLGLSQRRTRYGARMQCILHHHWDPAATRALIRPGDLAEDLDRALGRVVTTVDAGVERGVDVLDAVLGELPRGTERCG